MSRACTQLRRLWQYNLPAATSPAAVKSRAPRATIATNKLFKEPNVDVLASAMKINSASLRKKTSLYIYAIDRLARHKRFSAIEDIIEAHKSFPDIAREGYATRLISLYGMAGMFSHAHHLFDELPNLKCQRTVLSFNSLMAAALHSKEFERVRELFRQYPSELGVEPDVISYNTLIKACVELGLVDEAISMVDEMEGKGLNLNPDLITFNSIVDGAYRKKGFAEGEKVWILMSKKIKGLVPDIKSYNAKLNGMISEGLVSEAVELFEELKIRGLEPNTFTYNQLIKGFCDRGDVEEAKKWYMKLVDGLLPNWITFEILVTVLCDNGETDLAFGLSKSMLGRHFLVDEGLLQMVVDKLVEGSKIEFAKKLVELARVNFYYQYKLVMPSVE